MRNFELTREYLENLRSLINSKKNEAITALLEELHPADIAEIYVELTLDEAKYIYFLIDDDTAADVITELEEDDRRRFLESLPSEVIAKRFIDRMDSDDAADVLGELHEDIQKEVLSHMEDVSSAGVITSYSIHYTKLYEISFGEYPTFYAVLSHYFFLFGIGLRHLIKGSKAYHNSIFKIKSCTLIKTLFFHL